MFVKSRHSMKFLVLNCLISTACNASALEVETPQAYVPNELSVNQKMLMLFAQYHMGNPKVLAAMLTLVPAATIASGVGAWFIATPLIGSVAGNTLDGAFSSAPSVSLKLPTLSLDNDTTSHPEEIEFLISRDMPADDFKSFIHSAGFFSAGAATMSVVLWHIFRS